jgi:hypothetical protein
VQGPCNPWGCQSCLFGETVTPLALVVEQAAPQTRVLPMHSPVKEMCVNLARYITTIGIQLHKPTGCVLWHSSVHSHPFRGQNPRQMHGRVALLERERERERESSTDWGGKLLVKVLGDKCTAHESLWHDCCHHGGNVKEGIKSYICFIQGICTGILA